MPSVLITGMSGTGKSSLLHELARRGHRTVDTDYGDWCEWVQTPDGPDWIWREDRMAALLAEPTEGVLYVAGCKSNQGKFSPQFGAVVLLSAPATVILDRLATRTSNSYGKSAEERAQVVGYLETVEPLLRSSATAELDATLPLSQVADRAEAIGQALLSRR